MFVDFFLSLNIFILIIIITLVLVVVYKVLVKKARPKSTYTPFDYITGMSSEELKDEEREDSIDDQK